MQTPKPKGGGNATAYPDLPGPQGHLGEVPLVEGREADLELGPQHVAAAGQHGRAAAPRHEEPVVPDVGHQLVHLLRRIPGGGEKKTTRVSTGTSHPPGNQVPPPRQAPVPNSPQDALLPVPGGTGAHQAEERPRRLRARGPVGTGAPGEDKKGGVRKPELLPPPPVLCTDPGPGAPVPVPVSRSWSRCPVPVSHRAAAPSSVRPHPAMAGLCSARPRALCRYRGGTAPCAR